MKTLPRFGNLFNPAGSKFLALTLLATAFISGCGGGPDANNTSPSGSAGPGSTDSVAPVVVSTSPGDTAVDVGIDSNLRITFSEPLDPTTVNGTTVKVRAGIVDVAGAVSCAYDTITFTPSANWAFTTTYTVTISGGPSGVRDVSGNVLASDHNWTFSTGHAPDTTPPTITGKSPENGATGVLVTSHIAVTFSEEVTNVTPATFYLSAGATQVPGMVIDNGDVLFLPDSPLAVGKTYTATVTTGVTDLAGNPMASDYVWTFTTDHALDTTTPSVTATTPIDGDFGIPVDTAVIVTFSEPVTNVTAATFLLTDYYCGPVPGVVTVIGSTAIFRPLSPLKGLTMYIATMTTGVTDLSGNALSSDHTWIFITEGTAGGWW